MKNEVLLLLRTRKAKENEKNFKRFSDLAPGGLVIMDRIGKLLAQTGCITDISRIKWADNLQARRLHEAEETRRAQNSFMILPVMR